MNFFQSDEPYAVHYGDAIEHIADMPAESVDFSVFSPPFPSLYAYNSDAADIGNSEDLGPESKVHLSFFYRQFARILKPGRVVVVHVGQIPRMKRSGQEGLFDFRGMNIRLGERAGLTFEYDWMVRVDPQAQAILTKSWQLKFQGIETDRAMCRGALPDYLLKFRAPGINPVAVDSAGDVSRNNWIDWAEPAWNNIRRTNTLNSKGGFRDKAKAKGRDDTKHICPLQLDVIERLVRLYSNPDEVVFSPFAGIGSEGVVSLKLGRRFYGCELKREYHDAALFNLDVALRQRAEAQRTLFDAIAEPEAQTVSQ